jgi:hypothetical protein
MQRHCKQRGSYLVCRGGASNALRIWYAEALQATRYGQGIGEADVCKLSNLLFFSYKAAIRCSFYA